MTKRTPEGAKIGSKIKIRIPKDEPDIYEEIKKIRAQNKIYRDQIHDLEQRLAMRNAEAVVYGEEALRYHKKEMALLEKTEMLQNKRYEYKMLYYNAQKELLAYSHYPKWIHKLFRNRAGLRV